MLRRTTVLLLAASAIALPGCGDDDASAEQGTTIDVVFGADGLSVTPTTVDAGDEITLTLASQDGRPHGVTLEGAPAPVRVVVTPGQTRSSAAGELPAGTYRVAPDGASEPVEITVRP